jgi:hypothetical protein
MEFHMPESNKPIFIIGAPRSGTTFLTKLLSQHSGLKSFYEPRLIWRYGNDSKSDILAASDVSPKIRKHITEYFTNHTLKCGKTRFLEKTPSNSLRLSFINDLFPNCKFIHIIRNGYDVSLSIRENWLGKQKSFSKDEKIARVKSRAKKRFKEMQLCQIPYYADEFLRRYISSSLGNTRPQIWGPRIPGISKMIHELDVLEIAALQWRTCVEHALFDGRNMGDSRYIEIKFEEISKDILLNVLAFCELSPDPNVSSFLEQNFKETNINNRLVTMTEHEKHLLDKWIMPTQTYLGY